MQFLRGRDTLRRLLLALSLFVAAALQGTPFLFPTVSGMRPELLLPFVVAVAVCEGEVTGGVVGLFAGLLWDLTGMAPFGYHGLFLMAAGIFAGLLVRTLLHAAVLPALLVSGVFCLLFELISWFFLDYMAGGQDFVFAFLHIVLPTALYSFAFVLPFYYWARFLLRRFSD